MLIFQKLLSRKNLVWKTHNPETEVFNMTVMNWRNFRDVALRQWWVVLVVMLLGAAGGAFWALQQPPEFEASGSFFIAKEEAPQGWRAFASPRLCEEIGGEGLRSRLKLGCSTSDSQIFSLHYWDKNGQEAAKIVNAVMLKWERLLEEEAQEKVCNQLALLQQKQREALAELEKMQGQGALSDHERVYLTSLQEEYRQKEGEIESTLSSLEMALSGIPAPNAPAHLNSLTRELRTLTHQKQALLLESGEAITRLQLCSAQEQACNDEMRHLFIRYGENLEKTRGEIGQIQQLLLELDKPYFNISNLSPYLADSVNASLITRACELLLVLADEELQAPQERAKLLKELAHFKGLLGAQLRQKLRSNEERYKRTQEELRNLNKAQIEVIDSQIAHVREELNAQVSAGKRALNEELASLRRRMADLEDQLCPSEEKWEVEQAAVLKKAHFEALTQLIDKEMRIQSLNNKPSRIVTPATLPTATYHTQLPLFSGVGGGAGLLLSSLFLVVYGVIRGPSYSPSTLRRRGLSVAGRLSCKYASGTKLTDQDLEVLRNVWSLLGLKRQGGIAPVSLIALGKGLDFSTDLARLLTQQGERVLLIRCNFHEGTCPEGAPGLVHYLKGKVQAARVVSKGRVDIIGAGGPTRYAVELLRSPRFDNLLRASRKRYGFVLVSSYAPLDGVEMRLLRELSDRLIVSLGREPLPPDIRGDKVVAVLR